MYCLFKVRESNKFDKNGKKITVSVYGVRTSEIYATGAEFLVYYGGVWIWMDAENYEPIKNEHS